MDEEDVGQGKLYSLGIQLPVKKKKKKSSSHEEEEEDDEEMISSRAAGIRWRNVGAIKDKLLEKLTAAAVPADALDNASHFLETVVRDVRLAAHGLTMDAFNRIKSQSHLSDFLLSLANKMVEDASQDATKEEEGDDDDDQLQNKNKWRQGEEERVTNSGSGSGSGNNNKSISSFMFPASSSLFVSLVKPQSRL